MVKITTTLLREELKRLGNPREVTYITEGHTGTLELPRSNEYAVIVNGRVSIMNPVIRVVINQLTININKNYSR